MLVASGARAAAPPPLFPALSPGLTLLERYYLFDDQLAPAPLFEKAGEVFTRDIQDLTIQQLSDQSWLYATPDCELVVEVPADATVRTLEVPLTAVGRFLEACSAHLPPELPDMDSYLLGAAMAGLDPYSAVFDERRQTEHNIQYQGRLAGIGARIGSRHDQLTLIEVYPDSPAARADLRDDDEVLRIDDLSTKNILATDAVQRIRGPEGTTVTLLVRRKGFADPLSVIVTRGIVMIPSVKSRMLEPDILYTEITQFSQTTPDDFRQHLQKAVENQQIRGVVIDLRHNSGGSMMGSSAIGDLFLREGLLITTSGRDGKAARGIIPEVRASGDAPFPDLPVIFLMSPSTASGSELLAASLRNNDRALLVGEHSFGKGCIQKTFPLHATSTMKMSVGHFLPNGEPIPGGGLVPDIEVLTYRVGKGRLAIPLPIHRSDRPFWLRTPKWSKAAAAPASYTIAFAEDLPEDDPSLREVEEGEEPEEEKENPDKPDRAIEIAAAILRNHGSASSSEMLANAQPFLQDMLASSENDLSDFMYTESLDWNDGPRPRVEAKFALEITATTPLRAGEETELELRLTNNSAAPFYRVRGLLDSTSGALHGRPVAFGRIEPGTTRAWRMKVKPPSSTRTGRVQVEVMLFDDNGEIAKATPVRLAVEETPRPHLAMQTRVATDPTDPTRLDIHVELENRGKGTAEKVVLRLKHPTDEHFEILEGTSDIGVLEPGARTSFTLKARLMGSFDPVPEATLFVTEKTHILFLERKLPLAASTPATEAWNESPRITIDGIDEIGEDEYELLISASDDHGLAQVRARIDDTTVAYLEPDSGDSTTAQLRLPWKPSDDVKRLRIEAKDKDGLTELYAGSM